MLEDFKKFALRGNVVDLAIGVIIGAAFGKIIGSLVGDIIMPVIGRIFGASTSPTTSWASRRPHRPRPTKLPRRPGHPWIRHVHHRRRNFVIIAFVLFLLIRGMNRMIKKEEAAPPPPAPPSKEVALLTEIRDLLKARG